MWLRVEKLSLQLTTRGDRRRACLELGGGAYFELFGGANEGVDGEEGARDEELLERVELLVREAPLVQDLHLLRKRRLARVSSSYKGN